MNLRDWEQTIQQIADESNSESKESGRHRVLTTWRSRLEQEPSRLKPFQIDHIVRAVRTRLRPVTR
jgi:hypothetical protein